jgi:hypothetical protein
MPIRANDVLVGREPLRAGTRYAGPFVVFGELDQSRHLFGAAHPVLDVVRHQTGWEPTEVRTVNCLVRDEPTNHLDVEAIEQTVRST